MGLSNQGAAHLSPDGPDLCHTTSPCECLSSPPWQSLRCQASMTSDVITQTFGIEVRPDVLSGQGR